MLDPDPHINIIQIRHHVSWAFTLLFFDDSQASEVIGIEIEQSIPLLVFALCVNGKNDFKSLSSFLSLLALTKFLLLLQEWGLVVSRWWG